MEICSNKVRSRGSTFPITRWKALNAQLMVSKCWAALSLDRRSHISPQKRPQFALIWLIRQRYQRSSSFLGYMQCCMGPNEFGNFQREIILQKIPNNMKVYSKLWWSKFDKVCLSLWADKLFDNLDMTPIDNCNQHHTKGLFWLENHWLYWHGRLVTVPC